MTEHAESRRLAAVMFTDLEGYTTMFHKNETTALHKINLHRQYLEEITTRHQGRIIQFYGDGSLVVYESVMDAVHSAVEIQQASVEYKIPIRIGIHVGDVIHRGDDIFGNAVNIASRIQSVGIPGSVVVSKKVADEVNNHPELGIVKLGKYKLKNISENLELYALKGSGLTIPLKQISPQRRPIMVLYAVIAVAAIIGLTLFYFPNLIKSSPNKVLEGRIIIPPFENLTLKPELDQVGEIASSMITYDLSTTSEADIVSNASILRFSNADMSLFVRNPALARQTGAANMMKGMYSLHGRNQDSLVFWASVVDTRTNKNLLIIPKVFCRSNDHMDCIREMSNFLRGYWKTKDQHVFRYPNHDAYVAYLKAQKIWASPDPLIREKAKAFLLQSISLDSMFLDAYFLLLDVFSNDGDFAHSEDTIELIKNRFPEMKPRDENFLSYYEEELYGRNQKLFQHFMKEYPNDSNDLFLNTTGMVLAIEFLNDPHTALRFSRNIKLDSFDLKTCTYCRTSVNMAMQAYADLADTVNAGKLAKQLKPFAERRGQMTRLLAYYMSVGDTAAIGDALRETKKKSVAGTGSDYPFYCLMAAQYARIYDNENLVRHYVNLAMQTPDNASGYLLSRLYYMNNELDKSEELVLAEIKSKPDNIDLLTHLGVIHSRKGDKSKADEIIAKLESLKEDYDLGFTPYFQGRIKAASGEKDAAIRYLATALNEGITFRIGTTFQHDPDLINLKNEKAFQDLLTRNRYAQN